MISRFRGSTVLAAAVLGASALLLSACYYHPGGLSGYSVSYRSYYGGHHGHYKRPHFGGHGHHHRGWRHWRH